MTRDFGKACAIAAVLVGASGCGTVGGDRNTTPYSRLPETTSMAEAHHFGRELVGYYSAGFESANSRRRLFNVGVWAATTYTTGAAGLAAHADNIFIGALTGASLGSLEPLVNEGGPEAWVTALGKTACLSRAATTGLDDETLKAVELLKERVRDNKATEKERRVLAVHEGVYLGVGNGYDQVYSEFLTQRTGKAIPVGAIADYLSKAKSEADKLRPASPEPAPAPPAAAPTPAEAVALSATTSLREIREVAGEDTRMRELFSKFNSGELKLLLPDDERVTLQRALNTPSLLVDNPSDDDREVIDFNSAIDDHDRDVLIPQALLAAIQEGVLRSAEAQAAAEKIQSTASNTAGAPSALAQETRLAEEAAIRVDAMNTAGTQQIDFCLRTSS